MTGKPNDAFGIFGSFLTADVEIALVSRRKVERHFSWSGVREWRAARLRLQDAVQVR